VRDGGLCPTELIAEVLKNPQEFFSKQTEIKTHG
jgi:hypothetical protein